VYEIGNFYEYTTQQCYYTKSIQTRHKLQSCNLCLLTFINLQKWLFQIRWIIMMRSHGICVPLLQQVFQSVVISKLTYAAPAWWGFSTSADCQRIETFLRRAARSGLWESATTAEELVNDADERLFWKVRHCAHHVLDELLPPKSDT